MIKVTIHYRENSDDKYGSSTSHLVNTCEMDTAVVTAVAKIHSTHPNCVLTSVSASIEESVLDACSWNVTALSW